VAGLALAVALAGCSRGGGSKEDPLAFGGKASTPCTQAIKEGHNREAAGEPTPVAFLGSLRECRSLAEWTAAANGLGIDLRGREPQFVDNTCNAPPTGPDVRTSAICQEANAAVSDPRRIP